MNARGLVALAVLITVMTSPRPLNLKPSPRERDVGAVPADAVHLTAELTA
jgi:hypothetical protein